MPVENFRIEKYNIWNFFKKLLDRLADWTWQKRRKIHELQNGDEFQGRMHKTALYTFFGTSCESVTILRGKKMEGAMKTF